MCLVYVQLVSPCGSRAHVRREPRCAMASVETSTTVLSGAVRRPVGGEDVERTASRAGYPLYVSIPCTQGRGTGRRQR